MGKQAKLELDGKTYILPVVVGSEGEHGVDISTLRQTSGLITLDDGYGNTGSCVSKITFIDGDKGILRYRGYPIEELAEKSTFIEAAYLIIYGELPTSAQLKRFSDLLTANEMLHESMKNHFATFPATAHPMAILSSMINAVSCYHPRLIEGYKADMFDVQAARLLSKVRTIAAFAYRVSRGLPAIYPKPSYKYTANFLHMMFSEPYQDYDLKPEVVRALDLIFLLHADHEQNCSTSTVRMIASSQANLFASAAGGVCALWGPLHGGAVTRKGVSVAMPAAIEPVTPSTICAFVFICPQYDHSRGVAVKKFWSGIGTGLWSEPHTKPVIFCAIRVVDAAPHICS